MAVQRQPSIILEKLADWKHQEAMLYEGAALTLAAGSFVDALLSTGPRRAAAEGLAIVFAELLFEKARSAKAEAEALLSKISGGRPVTLKSSLRSYLESWREFFRHPAGKMALATLAIITAKIILWLLEHKP